MSNEIPRRKHSHLTDKQLRQRLFMAAEFPIELARQDLCRDIKAAANEQTSKILALHKKELESERIEAQKLLDQISERIKRTGKALSER